MYDNTYGKTHGNTLFSFFPFLFQGDRTAELPSLCNVVFFYLSTFCFLCLFILINSGRCSNSPQFSRLLSFKTFNHGLNHWKIHTARQFCDFQSPLFLFRQSSMVINLYERTLSGNELFS